MILTEDERIWKSVTGLPKYEVSNDGLVRKVENLIKGYLSGYLMRPNMRASGHKTVCYCLHIEGRKYKQTSIQSLVRKEFGIEIEVDRKWVNYVVKHVEEFNKKYKRVSVTKKKKYSKVNSTGRRCRECGISLPSGYWRTCPECLRSLAKVTDELRVCMA